jgi:hypothetical protein
MNRPWVAMLGIILCWGCDSRAATSTSQPVSRQARAAASQPSTASSPAASAPADADVLYRENFQKVEIGEVPAEFLVLEGAFAVREMEGNRVLELPGEPLSTFGFLFGPSEKDGIAVRGRFHGTRKGRKFPSFGLGLGGAEGYQLIVSAGKDQLELFKGEEPVTAVEFKWTPQAWTQLVLRVRKTGDQQWKIEGKAWPQGKPEPSGWMITLETAEEPSTGRASVTASPYAGTPIQFDDLILRREQ